MELNKIIEVDIDPLQIEVPESNVLRLLGYDEEQPDKHVVDTIQASLQESKELVYPQGGYTLLKKDEIRLSEGLLFMGGQTFNIDKIIAAQLRKAEYIAVFICTIGKNIEKRSKDYMNKGDLLEGYVFDLIGSESAEAVAEQIHYTVKSEMKKEGYAVTNRFSPGYCNWSVAEQFKIFSFFDKNSFGISLNSSALMNPIKSVSAIIGVGTDVKHKPYTCSMCTDENCIYRNKKSRS